MATELSAFSERLMAYIKSRGDSVRGFERAIGVSNGWVSDVKSKVDINAMSEISLKFPDLNIRWLFSGEGEMIRSTGHEADQRLVELCKRLVGIYEQKDEAIHELSAAIKSIE